MGIAALNPSYKTALHQQPAMAQTTSIAKPTKAKPA
jgi:hypothetical protein